MKYVLIDRGDNVVDKVDLGSNVGLNGAKTFFIGRKQIDKKEFNNIWKVMTEKDYDVQRELSNREGKQYEWWKEEESYLDLEAPITHSGDESGRETER